MFSGGDSESGSTSNTGSTSTEQKENIEYIKLDVDTLNDALENNAASAKETYNKKYVEVHRILMANEQLKTFDNILGEKQK